MFKQLLILFAISAALGLGVNLISPNTIDYIGQYRDLSSGDGPIVPPTAEPGDPPFIDVNVAQMKFAAGNVLFVDARAAEEFECGTIPGSVNLPFEYIPEEGWQEFIDSCMGYPNKNDQIITFCSGEECDLSLHLARNLQSLGYANVEIFFGGAREWEKFDLEVERRAECGEY
jgi:rhodanese-related sulfurtransferase